MKSSEINHLSKEKKERRERRRDKDEKKRKKMLRSVTLAQLPDRLDFFFILSRSNKLLSCNSD